MNRIDQIIELVKTNPSPGLVLALLLAIVSVTGFFGKFYIEVKNERIEAAATYEENIRKKDSTYIADTRILRLENAQCKDQIILRTDEVTKRALEASDKVAQKFEEYRNERERLARKQKVLGTENQSKLIEANKLINQN